jgi:acetylornithine deacetylase
MNLEKYYTIAKETLQELIQIPSFSKEEKKVADLMEKKLMGFGYKVYRMQNNVWAFSKDYQEGRPTLLMNSHLDTVKPTGQWNKDPFSPLVEEGRLYGLGSNDAGGCLVSLMAAFLALEEKPQEYNRLFVASAEEEISGFNGFECVQEELGRIDVGIVGEPTLMEMAIAEKGLMVLDCYAKGKSGHAARNEGVNAISIALKDIEWINNYCFPKESDLLGPVKMSVTQIDAGHQHNVVPDLCKFVVDVRTNEKYSNQEVYDFVAQNLQSEAKARSFRMNSSGIELEHPLIQVGLNLGMGYYGSP